MLPSLQRTLFVGLLSLFVTSQPGWGQTSPYIAGTLQDREDADAFLTPPPQDGVGGSGRWKVEGDVVLFYFSEGQGAEVLFLHGGPGFPPLKGPKGLDLLTDDYRFLYYHQRGSGRSTRPFDRFESTNYGENLRALVQALGIDQQIADVERIRRILNRERLTLVGHSFGGFIATLYAVEFPQRVEKLVLISPAEMLRMPNPSGGIYEAVRQRLPEGDLERRYGAYLGRFFGGFGTVFTKSEAELATLNREFGEYFGAALEATGLPVSDAEIPAGHAGGWMPFGIYFSLGMQYDHVAATSRITCPVLLIVGDKDFVTTESGIESYRQNITNLRVVTLRDAGHFAFNDQPEAFAAVIRDFLEEEE